ncbi:MAG: c-type cytochrome biogenesis protein CcsB [Candidatus Sericytochromatia bacterium]|uniref:C-type cytochrome biogenesis protein CcsB n=1 Tax=Candidatus Tanganyikabacteria bacterium TaxID=2961651 RepID=A0A938BNQ8_9BACT|nr:c-type cytochrome biogenesis protein CcsB [Candidatus Tanganyikabacteria bacterium]
MGEYSSLDHAATVTHANDWLVRLDQNFVNATMALAALSTLVFLAHMVLKKDILRKVGNGTMAVAGVACLGALVTRYMYMIKIDPYFWPLSNLFESIMFMVFAIFVLYLVIERMFRPVAFGLVSAGLVTVIMALASLLPARLRDAAPLVPSLQSYWIKIHVTLMLVSYSAFFLSFVAATIYLFFHYRDQWFSPKAVGAAAAITAKAPITTIELLDELIYRLILLGFPILALGIITGGLWANHAWGTYWSWDPKETWALITWLFYAAYLHVRVSREWRGAKAAWFAVVGFASVLVTYIGVNYLAQGLHTYGKLL